MRYLEKSTIKNDCCGAEAQKVSGATYKNTHTRQLWQLCPAKEQLTAYKGSDLLH